MNKINISFPIVNFLWPTFSRNVESMPVQKLLFGCWTEFDPFASRFRSENIDNSALWTRKSLFYHLKLFSLILPPQERPPFSIFSISVRKYIPDHFLNFLLSWLNIIHIMFLHISFVQYYLPPILNYLKDKINHVLLISVNFLHLCCSF